jgi:hypothetical protein
MIRNVDVNFQSFDDFISSLRQSIKEQHNIEEDLENSPQWQYYIEKIKKHSWASFCLKIKDIDIDVEKMNVICKKNCKYRYSMWNTAWFIFEDKNDVILVKTLYSMDKK